MPARESTLGILGDRIRGLTALRPAAQRIVALRQRG